MTDAEFDVGLRLRDLRIQAELSQRALAETAGVPHGQISMIETNRSSPSVSSLRRILGGLGISMSDFFVPDTSTNKQPFFGVDELTDLTSRLNYGGRMTLRQIGDASAFGLQMLIEHYEPGADTGETMLEHEACEGGVVISGEVEVTVGDEVRVLTAGESYLFDSRAPHRFRNLSDTPAEVISACTPPYL